MMLSKLLAASICLTALSSCAGYQLGNSKPSALHEVQSIAIPLFDNETQEQRLATLATNTLVDTITRDGTYKVTPNNDGDATLHATITKIKYSERRSSRNDSLRASELYLEIEIAWQLIDQHKRVLYSGKSKGRSQFSVTVNEQLARNNAMADAAKLAAEQITLRLANGF